VALLIPAAIVSLFSAPLVDETSWAHVALQLVAWVCFISGASLRFWATMYIGGRKERELVTEGRFSLCRHPLYLGSLLLGLSGALFLESPLLVIAVCIVAVAYAVGTIPVEEAVLRSRHGQRYEGYAETVPQFWPHALGVRSPAQITIDVHRLWLECRRASRWIWLPLLGTLFTHLRALGWWPRFLRVF
jgi:protein-S-isoprenylcysteine O-methyltransferase Ste14